MNTSFECSGGGGGLSSPKRMNLRQILHRCSFMLFFLFQSKFRLQRHDPMRELPTPSNRRRGSKSEIRFITVAIISIMGVVTLSNMQGVHHMMSTDELFAEDMELHTLSEKRVHPSDENDPIDTLEPLAFEKQKGAWIGNTWIAPRPWRNLTPMELNDLYKDKNMLWVGDSTARRSSTTMYGILNAAANAKDNEEVSVSMDAIDTATITEINKDFLAEPCNKWVNHSFHPFLCRDMPSGRNKEEYNFVHTYCLYQLEQFLLSELEEPQITKNVDVMVISQGIWEAVPSKTAICQEGANNRTFPEIQTRNIELLAKYATTNPSTNIIWRTSGHYAAPTSRNPKAIYILEANKQAVQQITNLGIKNLVLVDWGGALFHRSFGPARIKGDLAPHYGLEGRLVMIQLIANKLIELTRVMRIEHNRDYGPGQ